MKNAALICLLFTSLCASEASEHYGGIKGCGLYKMAGVIRKDPTDILDLVVNEKSNSEYRFKPAAGELPKFAGFIDRPITLQVEVTSLNGSRGDVSAPKNITDRVPDPLHPSVDTGFILMKKRKCGK